jgi:arrestin-related trafficking adapter 1
MGPRGSLARRKSAGISPSVTSSTTSSSSSTTILVPPTCHLQVRIESPPLVMYGSRSESTGTLLSGMFDLEVLQDDPLAMKSVYLAVYQRYRAKRHPQTTHVITACKQCQEKVTELARWDVLAHPASLPKMVHQYPFSHLLPGSLPATVEMSMFSIDYYIKAVATPDNTSEQPFVISYPLKISRAVVRSQDRTSVRVFPPTALIATMVLPNVIHQNSSFPVELTLEGVSESSNNKNCKWKMRKINWRIDEVTKLRTAQCAQHAPPLGPDGLPIQDKGKYNIAEFTKTLSSGELKTGWKSDFSGKGKIQIIDYQISTHALALGCCNTDDPTLGLTVSHALVMELVIAEEASAQKSSRQPIPTGAARVLRMQFNLMITERSGLGIAWDDEVPPVYADIPLSPPDYDKVAQLPKFEDLSPSLTFVDGINSRLSLLASEGPRPVEGSHVDSPRLLPS